MGGEGTAGIIFEGVSTDDGYFGLVSFTKSEISMTHIFARSYEGHVGRQEQGFWCSLSTGSTLVKLHFLKPISDPSDRPSEQCSTYITD